MVLLRMRFVAALGAEIVLEAFGIGEPPFLVDAWISLSILAIPIAAAWPSCATASARSSGSFPGRSPTPSSSLSLERSTPLG